MDDSGTKEVSFFTLFQLEIANKLFLSHLTRVTTIVVELLRDSWLNPKQ